MKLLSVLLIPLVFCILIFAQENQYLTMEQCISRALSHNNLVKASRYAIKKAEWDRTRAWTELFPVVKFNTRYTWIDDSTLALRDFSRYFNDPSSPFQIPQTVFQESYFSSIDVDMPLFNGALINGLSIAGASKNAAKDMNLSTRHNTIYQVISAYLNVLRSREMVKLQQQYLELSTLNYEKAERLYQAGRYSKAEALRWKVEMQQQKSNLTNSESNLRTAQTALIRLINSDFSENIHVDPAIPVPIKNEFDRIKKMNDSDILKMISLDNDELIEVNSALSSAQSNTRISKLMYRNSYASFMPNISLYYQYSWWENNTIELDNYSPQTFMINFSIPLFSSLQNYSSLKSSYYKYRQNRENFEDQLHNTRYVLTESVNKLINLKTQIELSATNVEYNQYNYETVEQQREKGLISNIDFIDAKLNLQNAQLQYVSNQYDFISAIIEINYMLGTLDNFIEAN